MRNSQLDSARRLGRRELLRAATGAALVAPWLLERTAFAQAAVPQNLLVVTWPDGLEEGWHPTGGESSYELGPILSAFEPHKKDLLIIGGMKSGMKAELDAHKEGPLTLWTGAQVSDQPKMPSIDQMVAQAIGGGTAFRSLHLGVQSGVVGPLGLSGHVHHAGSRRSIPSEDDPGTIYDQIFGAALPTQDPAALMRVRQRKKSVLDFVRDQLGAVKAQVGAGDRVKVDQHAEGIAAIEKSLAALGQVKCEGKPARPAMTREAAIADASFPQVCKLQTELAVLALQCGVTRVATLQYTHTDSQTRIPGVNPNVSLHGTMHDRPHAERVAINKFFVAQMAYVLDRLKAVSLGGTRTLLDETLVVFGSEMAVGNHKNSPMGFFVAGGGNRYFRLGRWLHMANAPRHTRLLTSVAQAMGLGVESVGEFTDAASVGPLQEVRG
jgi:hypothetical protein